VTRRLHALSGLVLFSFVLCHLLNHVAGILSLRAMEAAHAVLMAPWSNAVGGTVLAAALLVHAALALTTTYRRRGMRLPVWQWAQLLLGLSVPLLAADHVLATGVARYVFDLQPNYTYVMLSLWVVAPWKAAVQGALLVVAWAHGCLGLRAWMRLQPWYDGWAVALFVGALLVPTLALAGFVATAREIYDLAALPGLIEAVALAINYPGEPLERFVWRAELWVWGGFAALVLSVFAIRGVRHLWDHRGGHIRIIYPDGRKIALLRGGTVLEASQAGGIPHAAVCGGKARCSTCRVRVGAGYELLDPPAPLEQRVLERIGALPRVRLACQLRPHADLEVTPLLPPNVSMRALLVRSDLRREGQELDIAILFADLRGFTRLSEHKLPYDVVFLLNRYFAGMGAVITESGGRVDKFIGDGIMALFGLEHGADLGCLAALRAAQRMGEALEHLNHALRDDLPYPLSFGIGVHVGTAIVGEMGYGEATQLTAIGDSVNTASRLEAMTKDERVQLIVSEAVAIRAGVDLSMFAMRRVAPRGKADSLAIRLIPLAHDLPLPDADSASKATDL
jgi:adenylate cyclase